MLLEHCRLLNNIPHAVPANTRMIILWLSIFHSFILIKPGVVTNNLLCHLFAAGKYLKNHQTETLDISHFVGVRLTKEHVELIKKFKKSQCPFG